ncbi:fumarate reductase subunit C [bacterium]|nr:MAG: fumarate reductase subunit C [bacterium]
MSAVRPDKSKLYYPKMPATWWLRKPSYFLFMLRELSSVFIALFLVVFLIQIYQLTRGPEAYVAFAQGLSSPGWVIFHLVALAFAIYHSITWFQSSAVVLPLRLGERAIPPGVVTALHIGAWIAISLAILILFLALRG